MRIGVTMFATDRSMAVDELARAAEERGFSSLYLPEHTHIPVSTERHPSGGALPEEYKRTLDPLVALSFAAAATSRLVLGTGVLLAAQREPIVTAKAIASLDLMSGGRFVLGVGFGWNTDEIANHGVEYRARRDVVREHVLAMKELWAAEAASFSGSHVRLAPSWSWPKPVSGPPVLLGGAAGPRLFGQIAEYVDGWMPIGGSGMRAVLPELRAAYEKAGRDPEAVRVIPFGVVPERGKLDYYASLGIKEVVVSVPSAPADEVLPILDAHAEFI